MEDLKTPKGHFKINWPLNEDDNEAEPKAKNPKNSPKSSKLPIECPNCKNLFEDQDKLFDHVKTCNAPPETEEGGEKFPVQGISFLSQSSASNGNKEERQILHRPCPKSQRKIVPTEKARKICNAPPETEEGAEKFPVSLLTCIWRLGTLHILRNHF